MLPTTDASNGNWVLRASFGSLAPAVILLGLRLFTRWYILRIKRLDDLLLILALLLSIGESVSILFEVNGGLGKSIMTLTESDIILWAKTLWISIHLYSFSLAFTKLSILLGYLSVFPYTNVILASKMTMGFVIVTTVCGFVSAWFYCVPTAKFWDKSIPGTCHNPEPEWISFTAFNMAADLATILIPMPVVSRLNLASKARLWLIGIFSLGLIVVIVSIVRLPALIVVFREADPILHGTKIATLSTVESNIAICCASLPALRSFATRYMPALISFRGEKTPSSPPNKPSNMPGSGMNESLQSDVVVTQMEKASSNV